MQLVSQIGNSEATLTKDPADEKPVVKDRSQRKRHSASDEADSADTVITILKKVGNHKNDEPDFKKRTLNYRRIE